MAGRGQNYPSQTTIDRIDLPTNIKCLICSRNQIQARYSNKQLNEYRRNIYFNGALQAERPRCIKCTGTPAPEIRCVDCNLSKPLDQYSKRWRKDRDNAHCTDCQQKTSDQEPNLADAMHEEAIVEEYAKGSSAFSNISRMGSSLPSASKNNSNKSDSGTDDSGAVFIQEPLSARGRSDSTGTAETYNTTSTTMSNGTSTNIRTGNRGTNGASKSAASYKWVKPGGRTTKTPHEKAMEAQERAQRQKAMENYQRHRDDDEEDEEDDSDSDPY